MLISSLSAVPYAEGDTIIKSENHDEHGETHARYSPNSKSGRGSHQHKKGEWMLSYRFMMMTMKDNRDGTNRLDISEVLSNGSGDYRVAPTKMIMNMHMLGLMYAPSENYKLMAMIPYISNEMDHVTVMGTEFSTKSSHLGDVSLSISSTKTQGVHWTLGLSLPTGSQDQKDTIPTGRSVLPYPMQIGSGTYDLIGGIGYLVDQVRDSAGLETRFILRLGENDDNYKVGNQYDLTGWYSRQINQNIAISVRGTYQFKDNYSGTDSRYAMAQRLKAIPTVDEDLRRGHWLNFALGINFFLPKGNRVSIEYLKPVWQNLNGPQLEIDQTLTLGWQLGF